MATSTPKITLNTILTEALRFGLVDIWQVITWQVNEVPSDVICAELTQKIKQDRANAQQVREKQDELDRLLGKAERAGIIDVTTRLLWSTTGVTGDIWTSLEQQIARTNQWA